MRNYLLLPPPVDEPPDEEPPPPYDPPPLLPPNEPLELDEDERLGALYVLLLLLDSSERELDDERLGAL